MNRTNKLCKTWYVGAVLALGMISGTALAGDDRARPTAVEFLLNVNGAQALVGAVLYVDEAEVLDFSLVEFLGDSQNRFILFAPGNSAFENLLGFEPGSLAGLSADAIKDALGGLVPASDVANILLKHVVVIDAAVGPRGSETPLLVAGAVTAVDGSELSIGIGADGVTVNAATIIKANVRLRNGIVHFIDTVL